MLMRWQVACNDCFAAVINGELLNDRFVHKVACVHDTDHTIAVAHAQNLTLIRVNGGGSFISDVCSSLL